MKQHKQEEPAVSAGAALTVPMQVMEVMSSSYPS